MLGNHGTGKAHKLNLLLASPTMRKALVCLLLALVRKVLALADYQLLK